MVQFGLIVWGQVTLWCHRKLWHAICCSRYVSSSIIYDSESLVVEFNPITWGSVHQVGLSKPTYVVFHERSGSRVKATLGVRPRTTNLLISDSVAFQASVVDTVAIMVYFLPSEQGLSSYMVSSQTMGESLVHLWCHPIPLHVVQCSCDSYQTLDSMFDSPHRVIPILDMG